MFHSDGQGNDRELTLKDFWLDQGKWSQTVFGKDSERGSEGPLKHLVKEVQETLENKTDVMEYVDCFFLIIDAARRQGFTYEQFWRAVWEKLKINKKRKWGKASTTEPVEHVRNED